MTSELKDGRYLPPASCLTPQCKSKTFIPRRSDALTVDWQKIKVQEVDDDSKGAGRIPRTVECELAEELVDSCVPGDVVALCGIVRAVNTEEGRGRPTDKNKGLFFLYIQAVTVQNNKQVETGQMDLMQFSMKDMYLIQELTAEKNLFRLVVNSLAPSIYGNELVKAGLLLALFGGCQKYGNEKTRIPIRGDPHVLVVGDPGLGKSQMLQSVTNLAPRGVYVCGAYSSTTGLTVTLLKEKGSGDYALEAGALVLADQGCCCIDEFDKMGHEHQALLEAMEQQSISIAKAGIVCTLPARTSVVAAANPVGGHYNRAKTVCENLKLSPALLSRFDLIFILVDKPDEQKDQLLSDYVMSLHSGSRVKRTEVRSKLQEDVQSDLPLKDRLRVDRKSFEPVPSSLLRKFIGYAHKYVTPKMSEPASLILEDFYLTLREKHKSIDTTPITTRQLESLIRLSEARAKVEMREVITAEDALDVIEIMKESLFDSFEDEYGLIDFNRGTTGMSKAKQASRFIAALTKIAEKNFNTLFTLEQLRHVGEQINLQVPNFRDFIEGLNTQNYLMKKRNNTYAPHSDYSAKTEQQLIEEIKKEDIDCFGYSILDDDKISGTLTSSKKMQMKYELRKKLRQQSFDCIKNFQL
eukprot:TRINITY_DN2192_c0_g2_i2.p1 TRINITY_DN2192_c0_g2~~TRINITY_DN2192_c0_g2_i2.p1  ORF type:complete len:637 (-),score=120.88 TRINITY_DN2192_c0_g2_i2:248-2158(-)